MIPFYEFATRRPITLTPNIKRSVGNMKTLWRKRAEKNGHHLSNFRMALVVNPRWISWNDHALGYDPTFLRASCKACNALIYIIADLERPIRQFKMDAPCSKVIVRARRASQEIHSVWRDAILTEVPCSSRHEVR